jgi:hypothetical protein
VSSGTGNVDRILAVVSEIHFCILIEEREKQNQYGQSQANSASEIQKQRASKRRNRV